MSIFHKLDFINCNYFSSIIDDRNGRPIHYAAACEGPAPLELLLSR